MTNDEIFCATGTTTDNGKEQLWSIPIEKGPEGDIVYPEHASFILEDETIGWGNYFYADADQIIYERCETSRPDKETPSHTASLYIYDCLTGEKRPFVNDKQWKEVYQKNGIYENNMEYMDGSDFNWKTFYIDKNILYVVDTYGILVFSIDLEGDQTPRYERQLSEWLEKTEYEVTTFDHGRCYTLYENDPSEEDYFSIPGYYDLEKNEYVETEEK